MQRSLWVGALFCLCSGSAWAADREHKFFYSDFSPTHCWPVTSTARGAPAFATKTAGSTAAGKSPGLTLLGDEISGLGGGPDPQLAVSPRYVMVLEAHSYVFYDRSTNQPLASSGCVPLNGSLSALFAPLLQPIDPATKGKNAGDINYNLEFGPNPTYPCDPNDYLSKPKPAPPSGCIQGNYDGRTYFDYDTRRFWVVAAARNHIWDCPDGNICPEARRYVFVAVSKSEDPRDGFWEYVLVRDYADWPLFSVRNKRLLLAHGDGKRVFVFDADKLKNGTKTDPFLGQYLDAAFADADGISLVTQNSDADGLSLILGVKGKNLIVYAFKNPAKPLTKAQMTLTQGPSWAMQPVYRLTKFYFTDDRCVDDACSRKQIDVHRVTTSMTGSPVTVKITKQELFELADANADMRMPGVLIEEDGSVLTWYQRDPTGSTPPEARYNILYPNEPAFRASSLLRKSDSAPASIKDLIGDEQIGGASEPGKPGFWITHLYLNSSGGLRQAVGFLKP